MSGAGARSLTCREAIDLLADYLEAALTAEQITELEAHLADCKSCQAYRGTKSLICGVEPVEMPAEMRQRLSKFLIKSLAKR